MDTRSKPQIVGLFVLSLITASSCSVCDNKTVFEAVSPTSGRTAVVFVRSCGVATGFSTHVSILDHASGLRNESGSILVIDDNHGAAPLDAGHALNVLVSWTVDDRLVIRYPRDARVFKRMMDDTVRVEFAATP